MHASRTRRNGSRRRFAAFPLLLAACVGGLAAPAAADLATLLRDFAAMPGFSARFREDKQIALLEAPLVSEGMLYFAPPDRLARFVERPVTSAVILSGRTLRIRDGKMERSIDLVTTPAVGALVDGLRLLLAGDREALAKLYDMELREAAQHRWTLRMLPRGAPLTDLVREIEVSGRGRDVDRVRVKERSGDESSSVLSEIDANRHFDAAEQRRLFGVPPP